MRRLRQFAVGFLIALSATGAFAQWSWKDTNGTTVYSDRAPPPWVKPSQILQEPKGGRFSTNANEGPAVSGGAVPSTTAAATAPVTAATGDKAPKTTAELEADFRKRQMEKAEAEKKSAEDAKSKQAMSDNCARSRDYLRVLDEGRRIRLPNGDVADDAQREAERTRARDAIAQNCK